MTKVQSKFRERVERLQTVRRVLNEQVFERQAESDGILMSLLSGEPCLFLGDVGTAKTHHIRLAAKLFDLSTFDILMSESTRPEQIFGPTDIPALARGEQRTKITGYAPTADVLFFDEVFKANAIVLNPLLWLINERLYRNGDDGVIECPTKATFAASNEIPTDPVLRAFYDRLTLRYEVSYLKDNRNLRRMIGAYLSGSDEVSPVFEHDDINRLRRYVKRVVVPDEIKDIVIRIRDQVQMATSTSISDRRLNKAIRVMQAHAVLEGRRVADVSDTEVLAHIFWDKPEHRTRVQAIALAHASADIADLLSYEEIANSVWDTALKTGNMTDARKKLKDLYNSVKGFKSNSGQVIARQVKGRLDRVRSILKQRGEFILLKIETDGKAWYKLSTASATVWTPDQLRLAGFKLRRKGQYWWTPGPEKRVIARIKSKLAVDATVKKITN